MLDKFLTTKNVNNNFKKKENVFNLPHSEIHLNYFEKPENELMDFQTLTSHKYSERNVYPTTASFEKPSYSSIHLKKINELQNESNKNINMIKSTSLEYTSHQSSPSKRIAARPPKPNNFSLKQENRKIESNIINDQSTPIGEYMNEWDHNNNIISKTVRNNSLSKSKNRANENSLNNLCQRSNNFMTNDNVSRRSNSNQSRKSNNSVSSVSNYLDKRHQQTQEKLNKIKMEKIKKETEELKPIPKISENSKKIVENLNQGGNVVDRLTYAKFEKKSVYQKKPQYKTNNQSSQEINKIDRVLSQMKEANKELRDNNTEHRMRNDNNINIVKNPIDDYDNHPGNIQKKLSRESRRKNSRSNLSNTSIDSNSSKKRGANSRSIEKKKEESQISKPIKLRKSQSKDILRKNSKENFDKMKINKEKNQYSNEIIPREKEYVDPNKEKLINVRKSLNDFLSSKQKNNIHAVEKEGNISKMINNSIEQTNMNHYYNNKNFSDPNHQDQYRNSNEIHSKIYTNEGYNEISRYNMSKFGEEIHNPYLNKWNNQDEYNQNNSNLERYNKVNQNQNDYQHNVYNQTHIKSNNTNEYFNQFTFKGNHFPNDIECYDDNNFVNADSKNDTFEKNNKKSFQINNNHSDNISICNINNKNNSLTQKNNNIKASGNIDVSNENQRLLSNTEIYNLIRSNKFISEEQKFKILEDEMIKISKMNGLELQEPPMNYPIITSNYKKPENEVNKFRNDSYSTRVKDPNQVHRLTENSIDYNSINTSNSEKHCIQYNHRGENQSKVIVNKTYNFQNPINLLGNSEEVIKKNSIDLERVEKSLEITNDKLKLNTNAKNNLINKMDHSSRDLSKFLNH